MVLLADDVIRVESNPCEVLRETVFDISPVFIAEVKYAVSQTVRGNAVFIHRRVHLTRSLCVDFRKRFVARR